MFIAFTNADQHPETRAQGLYKMSLTRMVFPTTPSPPKDRRTFLEESVHDVAVECLRHESKLAELSLGNLGLHREDLQKWCGTGTKSSRHIEAVIKDVITVKAKIVPHNAWVPSSPLSNLRSSRQYLRDLEIMLDGMKTALADRVSWSSFFALSVKYYPSVYRVEQPSTPWNSLSSPSEPNSPYLYLCHLPTPAHLRSSSFCLIAPSCQAVSKADLSNLKVGHSVSLPGEVIGKLQTSWDDLLNHGDEPFVLSFPPVRGVDPSLTLKVDVVHAYDDHDGVLFDTARLLEAQMRATHNLPRIIFGGFDHPDYAAALTNLTLARFKRYIENRLQDIGPTTSIFRKALTSRPQGHPDHVLSLLSHFNIDLAYNKEPSAAYIRESAQPCCKLLPLSRGDSTPMLRR
ncbi:hypothetical protein BDR05DRAFT_997357 [Suillus weaverae]|nr:hypothetical protein BDR05DRAFT_997357 [Suillus weaverae]